MDCISNSLTLFISRINDTLRFDEKIRKCFCIYTWIEMMIMTIAVMVMTMMMVMMMTMMIDNVDNADGNADYCCDGGHDCYKKVG